MASLYSIFLLCLLLISVLLGTLYLIIYLLSMEMPSFRVIRKTFKRDFMGAILYFKVLFFLRKSLIFNYSVADLFSIVAKKHANKVCFVFEGEEWTFNRVDDFTNKLANAFKDMGYKKGDEVALVMENCPEYICIWLGLSKIGVVTALINTNLRQDALGHSINILDIKAVIFGKNFADVVQEAVPFLKNSNTLEFYCYKEKSHSNEPISFPAKSLNSMLDNASSKDIDLGNKKPGFSDKLFYVYTSGTTGLPKAAVIRNSRFLWISVAAYILPRLDEWEIFYNPLPLYHSAGGILFLGGVLVRGGTMVIRKKFSASNFWKDVVKHNVTCSQYIGEICRYLLAQPYRAEETQHHLKLMFGNGLRPSVWQEFQTRFKIKQIVEIYGSTEGNANLVNMFSRVGAVGFVPMLCNRLYPVCLMKVNPETGELLRDKNGLGIRCKPGEPGELVGKIVRTNPLKSFDGYANKTETRKKIAFNCFRHGDSVFLSGDILVMDEEGYLSFVDRTGDTFRWKGENVSTGEVENIISKALNHTACVVYGVEIPNSEGRAGMAAIQIDVDNVDFKHLYRELKKKLPSYAVPIFFRVSKNLEATGTFKLRKVSLQKEGYDVEQIADPLFFLDNKQESYVPLTKEMHSDILSGKMKL